MNDAERAEMNEKSILRFLFFELSWKFIENWGDLSIKMTKNNHNSKNENRKIKKFDFYISSYRENSSKIGAIVQKCSNIFEKKNSIFIFVGT